MSPGGNRGKRERSVQEEESGGEEVEYEEAEEEEEDEEEKEEEEEEGGWGQKHTRHVVLRGSGSGTATSSRGPSGSLPATRGQHIFMQLPPSVQQLFTKGKVRTQAL